MINRKVLLLLGMLFLVSCSLPYTTIPEPTPKPTLTQLPTQDPCLNGGNQNTINARLKYSGSEAVLCQGAIFELTGPVIIRFAGQKIYTQGYPEDNLRAVLRIVSENVTSAIIMPDSDNAVISNIIIDGNRPTLGYKEGEALVFAGGDSRGQTIRAVKITEPRSWSALHLIEPCTNALVEDSEIGPAGMPDGTWADGISLACTNSTIRNNLIVDATDGGIVIFAATGSLIENNIIRAESRTLLGGIHMVEPVLHDGNFTGTVVQNNIIEASGAVIRIAVPMGPRIWLCLDEGETISTPYGGVVINNILRGDYMQYGFAVDGVSNWTVMDNIDESNHIGIPTIDCRGQIPSKPYGFQYYLPRSEGTFQQEFQEAFMELALWAIFDPQPGE